MKIATWNIERMAHSPAQIQLACEKVQADILVLTESDDRISLKHKYRFHTPTPPDLEGTRFGTIRYAPTEHRVSIFTNYKPVRQHSTTDEYTSLCVELETERGDLLVYPAFPLHPGYGFPDSSTPPDRPGAAFPGGDWW